ncbi:MAG: LytTR family DNA-binding domain-containing protein [Pyrinomonadaceae bacterium]
MRENIKVLIADDERPAREFLKNILRELKNVSLVGEAENGAEALEKIRSLKPDLALLDLQMPEMSGLEVVKNLSETETPFVAFVTAYDEFAVRAFEVNAVDYLLKPVEKERLAKTINRVFERMNSQTQAGEISNLRNAVDDYAQNISNEKLERIPIKNRGEILLIAVTEIASIIADGELLRITTLNNQKYVINFRLKDLEARLDAEKFARLSRGALANVEMFEKVLPMSGGVYQITLKNGQEILTSRQQSRILRERLLKL